MRNVTQHFDIFTKQKQRLTDIRLFKFQFYKNINKHLAFTFL